MYDGIQTLFKKFQTHISPTFRFIVIKLPQGAEKHTELSALAKHVTKSGHKIEKVKRDTFKRFKGIKILSKENIKRELLLSREAFNIKASSHSLNKVESAPHQSLVCFEKQ